MNGEEQYLEEGRSLEPPKIRLMALCQTPRSIGR